jgi:hypothetical protein
MSETYKLLMYLKSTGKFQGYLGITGGGRPDYVNLLQDKDDPYVAICENEGTNEPWNGLYWLKTTNTNSTRYIGIDGNQACWGINSTYGRLVGTTVIDVPKDYPANMALWLANTNPALALCRSNDGTVIWADPADGEMLLWTDIGGEVQARIPRMKQ